MINRYDPGTGYSFDILTRVRGRYPKVGLVYEVNLSHLMDHTIPGRQPFLLSENGRVMIRLTSSAGLTHDFEWLENVESGSGHLIRAVYECGAMQIHVYNG